MKTNQDVEKILLKLDNVYYEKGMKNITIPLKGIRKEKISEKDRKIVIPMLMRSKYRCRASRKT